jgi:hypothetical protein
MSGACVANDNAAAKALDFATHVQRNGSLVFQTTLIHLGMMALTVFGSQLPGLIPARALFLFAFEAIGFLMALSALYVFDTLNKSAATLFEQSSDEIDAALRSTPPVTADVVAEFRVALRALALASDLPLLPCRWATAAYAIANFLIVVVAIIFLVGPLSRF